MLQTRIDRRASALLEWIGKRLWGFPPRLMPSIVRQLGGLGALRWFVSNMPRYEATLRAFGPVRTHLLCVMISLRNGCPYCTFGHAYALELAFLREHDALFPLDEQAIVELHHLEPDRIRDRMVEALRAANVADGVRWVDRVVTLSDPEVEALDADDRRVKHLVRMFGVLNSCGIADRIPPDEAHDPLNKDLGLKARYASLRAAASP